MKRRTEPSESPSSQNRAADRGRPTGRHERRGALIGGDRRDGRRRGAGDRRRGVVLKAGIWLFLLAFVLSLVVPAVMR